jgi:hypothetical protein
MRSMDAGSGTVLVVVVTENVAEYGFTGAVPFWMSFNSSATVVLTNVPEKTPMKGDFVVLEPVVSLPLMSKVNVAPLLLSSRWNGPMFVPPGWVAVGAVVAHRSTLPSTTNGVVGGKLFSSRL